MVGDVKSGNISLLEQISGKVNIDVDSLDTDFIRCLPITPNDQTCNPAWLNAAIQEPSNQDLLTEIAASTDRGQWQLLNSRLAVALCKRNLEHIKGRVLVQTSPGSAYDTEAAIKHARLYASEFEKAGISRDRFCIKILATGPGLVAARTLQQKGIQTLGTAVFGLAQAIACSQAGCLYINLYYNEIKSHVDPTLWPNVEDPAMEHPFSSRLAQMASIFKELEQKIGRRQPLVKNAAYRSCKEVIATAELGCHSATISKNVLADLAGTPANTFPIPEIPSGANVYTPAERLKGLIKNDPLAAEDANWKQAKNDTNFLADNGGVLESWLADHDTVARSRLQDALAWFKTSEEQSKQFLSALGTRSAL